MKIQQSLFGKTPDGTPVELFTLTNDNGMVVKLASYGATITELHVPDRHGETADVALGFAELAPYLRTHPYLGCMVGRVVNRIRGAAFSYRGKTYKLTPNDGPNAIHGGPQGMARRVWKAAARQSADGPAVEFVYESPDGEEGFPGNLRVTVFYRLLAKNTLRIDMLARTDQPTPVNLANHNYFNLHGAGNGTILDHELFIPADYYTPSDSQLITTGEIRSVAGTPFDFTRPTPIGRRMGEIPPGYDCNFVLRQGPDPLHLAARLREIQTARILEVYTTQPGVQLYTGNFLDGGIRGIGGAYPQHSGVCLETQHFPNAVHHPHFPTIMLAPGEEYRHAFEYRFCTN